MTVWTAARLAELRQRVAELHAQVVSNPAVAEAELAAAAAAYEAGIAAAAVDFAAGVEAGEEAEYAADVLDQDRALDVELGL